MYILNTTPIKIPIVIFYRNRKTILKLIWNHKRLWTPGSIFRKKNKTGNITFLIWKYIFKTIVTKTVWYWQKNRQIGKWNKKQGPEINPWIHGQIINKGTKNAQQKKDKQMVLRKLYSHMQIHGIGSLSYTLQKNRPKMD